MINYSNKLKSQRALNECTQSDIAKMLGISVTSYSCKESGKKDFTLSEAKKIADYFKITIDKLFFAS